MMPELELWDLVKTKTCKFVKIWEFSKKLRQHQSKKVVQTDFENCGKQQAILEALCLVFIMRINFQSYTNKTIFHMKSLICTQPCFHSALQFQNNLEIDYQSHYQCQFY